ELVERLVLAWPATGGDPVVDERTKTGLLSRGDRVQLLMSC
ncbi:MAG: hypothetical protein QOH03_5148, partial [Kribbellaceae bacterium]|nr:hypothetical protein [Kribbellaceae bacterium]